MSTDYSEVVAAVSFEAERRAYFEAQATEAELELRAIQAEESERQLGRREAGLRYAEMLGLPSRLGQVAAVMTLSPSPDARGRASGLIVRALLRSVREAA